MITLLAAAVLGAQGAYSPNGPIIQVQIEGRGKFEITTDPKNSPKTVAHIKGLVEKKFYDRPRIHRGESWVTQWGAPASKTWKEIPSLLDFQRLAQLSRATKPLKSLSLPLRERCGTTPRKKNRTDFLHADSP